MNLRAVLREFGIEAERIRLIKRGANVHWAVASKSGRFVLRRYGQDDALQRTLEVCLWEHELTTDLVAHGYPALAAISPPQEIEGEIYAVFPFLQGAIWRSELTDADYHRLGTLLAEYHAIAAALPARAQRPGWSCFVDGAYPVEGGVEKRGALLAKLTRIDAEVARLAAAALENAEPRLANPALHALPLLPIHSDFSTWNLAFSRGALSGVFDFDLAHLDSRAADLAFTRRGYHDAVVGGYRAHTAMSDAEIEALDALWVGSILRFLWVTLEQGRAPPADDLRWMREQFGKVRPYRG